MDFQLTPIRRQSYVETRHPGGRQIQRESHWLYHTVGITSHHWASQTLNTEQQQHGYMFCWQKNSVNVFVAFCEVWRYFVAFCGVTLCFLPFCVSLQRCQWVLSACSCWRSSPSSLAQTALWHQLIKYLWLLSLRLYLLLLVIILVTLEEVGNHTGFIRML